MRMGAPTVLIAGVGNIFFGDDAFGVEVVRRLGARALPEGVRVVDFGIRGLDLAYTLLDGAHAVTILVDAVPRGGTPGTLYAIELDSTNDPPNDRQAAVVQTHGMSPVQVFRMVRSMGGDLKRVIVVGCEPLTLEPEEGTMGLSPPVEAAVDEAISLIESLVGKIFTDEPAVRPTSIDIQERSVCHNGPS
jgi:hydrogenase maturation protease